MRLALQAARDELERLRKLRQQEADDEQDKIKKFKDEQERNAQIRKLEDEERERLRQ